jgi:AhpD family alkylhydroperoxidase
VTLHARHLSLSSPRGLGGRGQTARSPDASALPLDALGPEARRAVVELDGALWLDPGLRELVRARTAQLTGCADSLARHAWQALELGESPRRLAALSGWRRSGQFSGRERAALGVADALACVPAGGVAAACRHAADHFDDTELAELVFACATANLRDGLELALAEMTRRRQLKGENPTKGGER